MAEPATFELKQAPPTVLEVTTADGQRYDVKLALAVVMVAESGVRNPLDGTPIFNVTAHVVTQVTRATDG